MSVTDKLIEKGLGLVLHGTEGALKKILPEKADRIVEEIFEVARQVTGETKADAIEKALTQNPELLAEVQLKSIEIAAQERIRMLETSLEELRIAANDRASARGRQISMSDQVPAYLGTLVVGGFFAALFTMMFMDLPSDSRAVLNIMVGSLGTMTASVMGYYFGSSAGSMVKTKLMQMPHAKK